MTALTPKDFLDAVTAWAALRNDQFKFYWPVKGGWEGWVQVDLTAFMLSKYPTLDIRREQRVFQEERQKCDLLLNADEAPENQIIVELKAQSLENNQNLIRQVEDDLEKLSGVADDYEDTTCMVIAAVFNQATMDRLLKITRDDHRIFWSFTPPNTEMAFLVAEWTAEQGWLDPGVRVGGNKPARGNRPGSLTTGFGEEGFGEPAVAAFGARTAAAFGARTAAAGW